MRLPITGVSNASLTRVDRWIDRFIRSEYLANYQAERTDSGGYACEGSDARDRFNRCYDAAEDGADGMTHAEHISDFRDAFRDLIRDRKSWAQPDRFVAIVDAYFDDLEYWHEANGSLWESIG